MGDGHGGTPLEKSHPIIRIAGPTGALMTITVALEALASACASSSM